MKDWFFYQERGRTIGPLTGDDLRARIREGKVRLFDLVYKEGELKWGMACEHPDLKAEFGNTDISLKNRPWVCLHRKNVESFDFVTLGPLSSEEVRQQILSGQISYYDYLWQNGYSEWRRIGSIEEFNPRLALFKEDKNVGVPEAAAELLKNVVEFRRGQGLAPPAIPPKEASGEDLTKRLDQDATRIVVTRDSDATRLVAPMRPSTSTSESKSPAPPPATRLKGEVLLPEESEVTSAEALPSSTGRRRRAHFRTDWAIVAGLVFVLGLVIFYLAQKTRSTSSFGSADLESPPPAPSFADVPEARPTPADQTTQQNVSLPKALPTPQHEPTELSLSVQADGENRARMEVRTNGTSDYPVFLQIVGLPGQVSEGASYYRYLRLKARGDLMRALEIPPLKMPQGRFLVHVQTANLHQETTLNLGLATAEFKQAVNRMRKQHAASIWSERLMLYRLARTLETNIEQALKSQRFSMQGLAAIQDVKRSNGGNYIFFQEWWTLKQIVDEVRAHATNESLTKARAIREKIAMLSVWKSK